MYKPVLKACMVVLLLQGLLSFAATPGRKIVVGLSFTANSTGEKSEATNNNGIAQREGIEYWIRNVNAAGGIIHGPPGNQTSHKVELRALPDDGSPQSALKNYETLLNQTDFLFGPLGSKASVYVAENLTGPNKRLLIGISVSSDNFAKNHNAFSVIPRSSSLSHVALPFVRSNELVSVTYLIMDNVLGGLACKGFDDLAEENGISKRDAVYVLQAGVPGHIANWTKALNTIITLNNDALFVCGLSPQAPIEWMMPRMKDRDWTPKFMLALPFSAWVNFAPEIRNYVCGVKSINALSTRRGQNGNTADFLREFKNVSQTPAASHVFAAPAVIAGELLENAIGRARSLSDEDVGDALQRLDVNTFMGRIRFDASGQQLIEGVMGQFIFDVEEAVGPLLSASKALVIPMPTWKERVFSDNFGDSTVEWVVLGIFFVAFSFSCCFAVYICVYRERLKFSSPAFLLGVDVGSILIYTSTLFGTPNSSQTYSCHLQDWFLFLGVNIMFGCLFAKSWRVFLIHRNKTMHAVQVKDRELLPYVGAFIGTCLILCTAFSVSLNKSEITVIDEHRISKNYYECQYSTVSTAILAAQYVLVLVVMIIGSVIAIKIRKVKILSEPKIFGFAIYNMTLFMSIAMLVRFTITQQNSREERYIIHSICVILSAALSIFAMSVLDHYVPKKHESNSGGSITDSNMNHVSHVTKVQKLQDEVRRLKARIKVLESRSGDAQTNTVEL